MPELTVSRRLASVHAELQRLDLDGDPAQRAFVLLELARVETWLLAELNRLAGEATARDARPRRTDERAFVDEAPR